MLESASAFLAKIRLSEKLFFSTIAKKKPKIHYCFIKVIKSLTAPLGKKSDFLSSFLWAQMARKNTENKLLINLCANRRGCPAG